MKKKSVAEWKKEFALREALEKYSEWLEEQGYLDTDWRYDEPNAIDSYIEDKEKNAKSKIN